ncbi:hypothetical protein A5752_24650 [Mycobacterium sp. 852002-51961_SCH5331710]|nr:hypothetical protein A5752_24650 [Mycobacterium sp. 852002-51961_SCH5331710]
MLVLALGIFAGAIVSWSCASITLQLLGSLLTLFGFLFAYLRASHRGDTVVEQLRRFSHRLIGKQPPIAHAGSAHLNVTVTPNGAVGLTPLQDLDDLRIQDQVDLLAAYIRDRVNARTAQLYSRLGALEVEVARAHAAVDERAEEMYQKILKDLGDLRADLDRTQVLDLRTAIFGIYMIAAGVALGYFV